MSRSGRIAATGVLVALVVAGPAAAAVDVEKGQQAIQAAFGGGDGDDFSFSGTSVEHCRADGAATVRCFLMDSGFITDRRFSYESDAAPIDIGVATFSPDGQIATSRQPFAEPVVRLDPKIDVPRKLRRTKRGRLAISVAPKVAATVQVAAGGFGGADLPGEDVIDFPQPHSRTVKVPAGRTTVIAVPLTMRQRADLRRSLRRRGGSTDGEIAVRVTGDVGPANAFEYRRRTVRVVR